MSAPVGPGWRRGIQGRLFRIGRHHDWTRRVFDFNLHRDETRRLLGLTPDYDLLRWLRVLFGLPLSLATLHRHKILMQTGRVGRFRMNMSR
jgi:hypothetical protein